MITLDTFRKIALALPETNEEPHFEKTSFRVKGKIFATVDLSNKQACLKLSEIEQDVFASADRTIIYPVANKWGKQGWTIIEMKHVNVDLFTDAITSAYCHVAPKKLASLVRPNTNEYPPQ